MAKKPAFNQFVDDELEASVGAAAAADPSLATAIADAEALQALLDELVSLRKRAGLTQTDVARLMGVKQPTVSQFETESSDPRISTLQRYARAVGCKVVWRAVIDGAADYRPSDRYRESQQNSVEPATVTVHRKYLPVDWAAQTARSRFTVAA